MVESLQLGTTGRSSCWLLRGDLEAAFGNLAPSRVDSIPKKSYLEAVDGCIGSSSFLSFTHAKNHVDWTAGCSVIDGFVG